MPKNSGCKKKQRTRRDIHLARAHTLARKISKLEKLLARNPQDIAMDTALKVCYLERAGK